MGALPATVSVCSAPGLLVLRLVVAPGGQRCWLCLWFGEAEQLQRRTSQDGVATREEDNTVLNEAD
jgi:hypothetical protein